MKHTELKPDDFDPLIGAILESKGWIASDKDGVTVFSLPQSFGGRNIKASDAYKLQQMIDDWGRDTQ